MLFINHCTECDRRQLIFPSQVKAVLETDAGVELLYTCWCGADQTHLEVPADQVVHHRVEKAQQMEKVAA